MIIDISNHEFTILWDNVYYFALSNYPDISDWELKKLILFMEYEKNYNRETQIKCDNDNIMQIVNRALANTKHFLTVEKPKIITECTACKQKGCLTDFLCHTASIENAKSIFKCDKILSAVKARNKTGIELAGEPRNAAIDPPDFFDYIMLSWGNCQAGDRLVMERILNREPNEFDLSVGFKPGVRFYFDYDTIRSHKNFVNDGYHAAKIKDELTLSEYLHSCIIPEQYKQEFIGLITSDIQGKVHYINNDCKDIWDWSEKVYNFVIAQPCKNYMYK